MLLDIRADSWQEDKVEVPLGQVVVQIGCKYLRRLVVRVRSPLNRVGEVQQLLPLLTRGEDLEPLRDLANCVHRQELTDAGIVLDHFSGQIGINIGYVDSVAGVATASLKVFLFSRSVSEGYALVRVLNLHCFIILLDILIRLNVTAGTFMLLRVGNITIIVLLYVVLF